MYCNSTFAVLFLFSFLYLLSALIFLMIKVNLPCLLSFHSFVFHFIHFSFLSTFFSFLCLSFCPFVFPIAHFSFLLSVLSFNPWSFVSSLLLYVLSSFTLLLSSLLSSYRWNFTFKNCHFEVNVAMRWKLSHWHAVVHSWCCSTSEW